MKPFDLMAALAGAPVQTRDGRPVTQITHFTVASGYSLAGVVDEAILTWTPDGKCISSLVDNPRDLVMAPIKKTGWIARYNEGGVCGTFTTEEQARAICDNRTATYHQIEWEE